MPGLLYIVSVPIGNAGDITPRAADVLGLVDFVAAENPRTTQKLLHSLNLQKPIIQHHPHSAQHRSEDILARIAAGESCALCSDAGTPAISDPGEALVADAIALGIRVVPVPGTTAAMAALSVSGQSTSRFVFEGFLPRSLNRRREHLAMLQEEPRTILLYEAHRKLLPTLRDLAAVLGAERSITICFELTKPNERIIKTTLADALPAFAADVPEGEYVLVIAGKSG